MRIISTIGIGM